MSGNLMQRTPFWRPTVTQIPAKLGHLTMNPALYNVSRFTTSSTAHHLIAATVKAKMTGFLASAGLLKALYASNAVSLYPDPGTPANPPSGSLLTIPSYGTSAPSTSSASSSPS